MRQMENGAVRIRAESSKASLTLVSNGHGPEISVVYSSRATGFTPLELQAAALASCMDASLRGAARQEGCGPLGEVAVDVTAVLSDDAPTRLARFEIVASFGPALTDAQKTQLLGRATRLCTIHNTLTDAGTQIVTRHSGE